LAGLDQCVDTLSAALNGRQWWCAIVQSY